MNRLLFVVLHLLSLASGLSPAFADSTIVRIDELGELSVQQFSWFNRDTLFSGSENVSFVDWRIADALRKHQRRDSLDLWPVFNPCGYILAPNHELPKISVEVTGPAFLTASQRQRLESRIKIELFEDKEHEWRRCYCENISEYKSYQDPWSLLTDRYFGVVLTIPEDFPDATVSVRAVYTHELMGELRAERAVVIRTPRGAEDARAAVSAKLWAARARRQFNRVVEIADSADVVGLLADNDLRLVCGVARSVSPECELRYWDLLWYRTGRVAFQGMRCGNEVPRPAEPLGEYREYLQKRSLIFQRACQPQTFPAVQIGLNQPVVRIENCSHYKLVAGMTANMTARGQNSPEGRDYYWLSREESTRLSGEPKVECALGSIVHGVFWPESQADDLLTSYPEPEGYKSPWNEMQEQCMSPRLDNEKQMSLFAPDYAMGKTLRLIATFSDATGESCHDSIFVDVVDLITAEDSMLWYSNVPGFLSAYGFSDSAATVVLDMVDRGTFVPAAIVTGWNAANSAGRFRDALRILEAGYAANGFFDGDLFSVVPWSDAARARYELFKDQTIRRIEGRHVLGGGEIEMNPPTRSEDDKN